MSLKLKKMTDSDRSNFLLKIYLQIEKLFFFQIGFSFNGAPQAKKKVGHQRQKYFGAKIEQESDYT